MFPTPQSLMEHMERSLDSHFPSRLKSKMEKPHLLRFRGRTSFLLGPQCFFNPMWICSSNLPLYNSIVSMESIVGKDPRMRTFPKQWPVAKQFAISSPNFGNVLATGPYFGNSSFPTLPHPTQPNPTLRALPSIEIKASLFYSTLHRNSLV